jgi:hypothetical protein
MALRREVLIGYVRRVPWGGGRASQLWQPHLGLSPRARLEKDTAGFFEWIVKAQEWGGRTGLSPLTSARPGAG